MNSDGVINIPSVPPRHSDSERNAERFAATENATVTLKQPGKTQTEAPQAVVVIRVGAGQVNNQIRMCKIKRRVQPFVEADEVGVVRATIG